MENVKTTQSPDIFTRALEAFLQSPRVKVLEIGAIRDVVEVKRFERPYSRQGVFQLIGEKGKRSVYVKIYKNWRNKPAEQFTKELETEFRTMEFWYEQLQEFSEFTTFRPLFFSRELHCIITEAASGDNLAELVIQKARWFPPRAVKERLARHVSRSGELLARFQAKTQQEELYDYQAIIEDVDIRLKQLVEIPHSGFRAADRERVLKFYREHLPQAQRQPVHKVVMHRDFGLGNILVNDSQVIVHDFNRLEYGHPYMDFTRLFHQLEMLSYKPIYRPCTIRYLQDAYCKGYQFQGDTTDIVFRFFLLRHFFTHLLGLVRTEERSMVSRMYSRWVKWNHLRNIRRLIQ